MKLGRIKYSVLSSLYYNIYKYIIYIISPSYPELAGKFGIHSFGFFAKSLQIEVRFLDALLEKPFHRGLMFFDRSYLQINLSGSC